MTGGHFLFHLACGRPAVCVIILAAYDSKVLEGQSDIVSVAKCKITTGHKEVNGGCPLVQILAVNSPCQERITEKIQGILHAETMEIPPCSLA